MSDEINETEAEPSTTLFDTLEVKIGSKDLRAALVERYTKLNLGFMQGPPGMPPMAEANSLVRSFSEHRQMIVDLKHEMHIVSTAVRILSIGFTEAQQNDVAHSLALSLAAQAVTIREETVKEEAEAKKTKIITPGAGI